MCYSVITTLSEGNSVNNEQSPDAASNPRSSPPLLNITSDYFSGSTLNSSEGLFDADDLSCFLDAPVSPGDVFYPLPFDERIKNDANLFEPLWNYPQSVEQSDVSLVTSSNHSAQSFPCKVCGDKASGNHFGVSSCEACKSFFRRSIRTEARYSCRAGRCCEIDKQSRNRCQYCRLIKCIKVGMKKEAVQEERLPPGTRSKSTKKTPDHVMGSLSDVTSNECGSGSTLHSPSSLAHSDFNVSDIFGTYNLLDENKNTTTEVVQLNDFLGAMRAYAVKLIGWAQHIPAFAHLNFENQVRLLKASWCELYVLHLAVHNGSNPDTLVLGGGLTCKPDQIGDPEIPQLINRTTSEVSLWFESLSTEPVELACLKGILLFNPAGPQLSAEVKEVEVYQEQILGFLENHSKATHSSISQRFSKLLLRLGSIQSISKKMMQYLEVQQTLGHIQMDNLLVELLDAR